MKHLFHKLQVSGYDDHSGKDLVLHAGRPLKPEVPVSEVSQENRQF